IAGHNKRYSRDTSAGIPDQWDQFAPLIGKIPGQVGSISYGVTWNTEPDCSFNYLTGVEIADPSQLPEEFNSLRIASRRYVIFRHTGHVSRLPATFETIWSKW